MISFCAPAEIRPDVKKRTNIPANTTICRNTFFIDNPLGGSESFTPILSLILQSLKTTLLYLRFVIKNLVNYQTILPIKTRVLGEETLNIKSCILPHFYQIKQVNYGQRNKRRTPTEKSTKEPDVERQVL